jgi:hypothetical protein
MRMMKQPERIGAKPQATGGDEGEKPGGTSLVEKIAILLPSDDNRVVQRVLGNYEAPAFLRRARRVQEALDHLLASCRQQRELWLLMPRIRMGLLRGLAGEWRRLQPWLANEEQIVCLRELEAELAPQLRVRIEPTSSGRKLERELRDLQQGLETFNRRWLNYLPTVDLAPVNKAREGYNRYYLLEKERAMRSPRLARQGFQHLPLFTTGDLSTLFPILPIPKTKE